MAKGCVVRSVQRRQKVRNIGLTCMKMEVM